MRMVKTWCLAILFIYFLQPTRAYADFWGGDLPLLTQIIVNTLEQLSKLQTLIGQGKETIDLMRDINRGIRDAMHIIKTNGNLHPGVLSELERIEQVISAVEDLYGRVPKTQSARTQQTTDLSVAESIHLHNEAFRYADKIDPEAERIKEYARDVNPLGAGKLTAQGIGVVIHVLTQILRTNAAMLKIQSEQLALYNRRDKLGSQQGKIQYEQLSKAFHDLKPQYRVRAPSR